MYSTSSPMFKAPLPLAQSFATGPGIVLVWISQDLLLPKPSIQTLSNTHFETKYSLPHKQQINP